MTPEFEKKLLQQLLRAIDQTPKPPRKHPRLKEFFLWLGTSVVFLILFQLLGTPTWSQLGLLLAFFVLGMLVMFKALREQTADNWLALSPHVDKSSVESRLRELGA